MPDMFDHLHERMRLIGQAFQHVDGNKLWRWRNYDWNEKLICRTYKGDLSLIEGRRPSSSKSVMAFTNCMPVKIASRKVVEIPTDEAKIVDQLTANSNNFNGPIAVPLHYDGSFRSLRSSKDAFAFGFTQSMELSFKWTSGGEAALNKFETEVKVGLESRQDWSHETGEEEEATRSAGIAPEGPPGYDLQFILLRKSQPKKLKITGLAQIDHGVQLGKCYGSGKWAGNRGKGGRLWPRWAKYDSFYEELLPVLKGEGPRNLMFATHFRMHPVPDWVIRRLEAPLKIPYEMTTPEFDGATTIDQDQKYIRGPKFEEQALPGYG